MPEGSQHGQHRPTSASPTALTEHRPVPGSPGYGYLPGVGVWKGETQILDWCPTVVRQFMRFERTDTEDLGKITSVSERSFTIQAGSKTHTAEVDDVTSGKAWKHFTNVGIGWNTRTLKEVLGNIALDQAAKLPELPRTAYWEDDRLILPPADVLPAGYGRVAGTLDEWRDLLRVVAQSPRMAFAIGVIVAGVFVKPLNRQSYVAHLVGGSSSGKTTTQRVAAGFFGNPADGQVIQSWCVTKQGPGAWLRELDSLPGFRNDLDAAGYGPKELENNLLGWLEGATRDRSARSGRYMTSPGSWKGCLSSSGNVGIVSQCANGAIPARVVEINAPLTKDREHSETVTKAAHRVYGHGLKLLLADLPAPDDIEEAADKALAEIGAMELSGIAGRLAKHIALGVVGTRLIAKLAGVPEFAAHVVGAAREVLQEQTGEMTEHGVTAGDRLLNAVREHMAAHPALWPTREHYEKTASGAYALRDVAGWDTSEETRVPAGAAVLPSRLVEVAHAAGITDHKIALRELRSRGILFTGTGGEAGERLTYRLPMLNKKPPHHVNMLRLLPGETEQPAQPHLPEPRSPEPTQSQPEPAGLPKAEPGPCGAGCGWDTAEVWHEGQPWHTGCLDAHLLAQTPTSTPPSPERSPEPSAREPERATRTLAQPRPGRESVLCERLAETYPGSTREQREEAEKLWHEHMRGIAYRGPHSTAKAILNGALKHAAVPELPPCPLDELAEVFDNTSWRGRSWHVPGAKLTAGTTLRSADINGMYLSAGEIELGTGSPTYRDHLPEDGLKHPGWVLTGNEMPEELPYGFGGRIVSGMWVPTPIAAYLAEQGKPLPVTRSALWDRSRRWMRPHTRLLRDARKALIGAPEGSPADMALSLIKPIYARAFGGLLSSDKHNFTDTLRPDWKAMIIATAQVRMMRAAAKVKAPVLLIDVDAMVWPTPEAGIEPAGLTFSHQLGKWKPLGWGILSQDAAQGYELGRWSDVAKCIEKTYT